MKKTLLLCVLLLMCQITASAQKKKFTLDPALTDKDYAPHTVVVKFKSLPMSSNGRQSAFSSPSGHVIVKKLGASHIQQLFPNEKLNNLYKKAVKVQTGKKTVDLSRIYTFTINPTYNLESAINILLADEAVEYAEPVYNHQPLIYNPSDPGVQTEGSQYYMNMIKAREAWAIEKGDPNMTIGIIDYGFGLAHEDLTDNIQYNLADPIDGIDNDNDGYIDNYAGWDLAENDNDLNEGSPHGSFVAGIAAASTDNGKGMAGVGFKCKFLPVKIYSGPKQVFVGYQGIIYAVQKGCKVINLSWGRRGGPSAMEQDVINFAAIDNDVVIVAAAGNNGTTDAYYPASYENVISVTGTDWNDEKWNGSNYNEKVDISAPCLHIYSASDNQAGYANYGGTSFAAPQVAGAAALIRSHFPAMSAREVSDLLIATTDHINQIPANAACAGKIGSGRLNIERALKKDISKRLQLVTTSVRNQQGQLYAQNGDTVSLVVQLKSLSGDFNDLKATIRSLSPHIQVLNEKSSFSSFTQNKQNNSGNNQNQPFTIVVDKTIPPAISFAAIEITYTEDTFTATDLFAIPVNQNCITIRNNHVSLSVSSQGRIGFNDDIIGWYGNGRGTGFQYKNTDLLTEAGLMLGVNKQVSDNTLAAKVNSIFYDNQSVGGPLFTKNAHFTPIQHLHSVNHAAKDVAVTGQFSDTAINNAPTPLGILLKQQFYTWQDSKFIIIEYQLTNASGNTIDQLHAGIFSIWNDLGTASNQAKWDAAHKMGYVTNTAANSLYTGVQLLTAQNPAYHVMDNDAASIPIFDGFSAAEKFTSLSSGLTRTQSINNPQFIAHTLAAQLQDFKTGETRTIAFAILAGDNLNDLQASAATALQKFVALNTSPVPVLADLDICKNTSITLSPKNGSAFNFYADSLLQSVIARGKTLVIDNLTKDTTFYITGTDSSYESKPAVVQVKVAAIKADFSVANDTIGLFEKETLTLTDKSTNACKWFWQFGDGATSELQHPTHTYTMPGEYLVKLTIENSLGCTDSLTQKVLVVNGIQSIRPAIPDLTICKGESVIIAPRNGTTFQLYSTLPLSSPVASGSTFDIGTLERDTVFYITNTDFLFESEPTTLHIQVVNHTTDFAIESDTLDLFQNEVLQLTGTSPDATNWLWDFGDGTVSTEKHPTHTYLDTGTYTVKLITENNAHCKDSLSRTVQVIRTTGLSQAISSYFKLYPNPTDGRLYLDIARSWPLTEEIQIQVFNHLGQEVVQEVVQDHMTLFNLFTQPKGIYSVKITTGNKTMIKKIIRL